MEMKKINSGRLRAIGYDARARMLAGPARRRQHATVLLSVNPGLK
jgi:hypothetical protein